MPPKTHRKRPSRRERRTVWLVTNGKETEKTYLDGLKQRVDRSIAVTTRFINGVPSTVVKEVGGARSDIRDFDEVWIVVDQDGTDRHDFLARCRGLSTGRTAVHGVVSVPCFEVWLNAHYGPVRNYQDQAEAQRHYRELTGEQGKVIPKDFPWCAMSEAAGRCFLRNERLPDIDTQGPCPSTKMPHLLISLGLIGQGQ